MVRSMQEFWGLTTEENNLFPNEPKSSIPTIIKSADYIKLHSPVLKDMLELEALATDIYVLGYKSPKFRVSGQDFTNNIIIADNKIGGSLPNLKLP